MTMLEERVSSIEGAYDHLATKADVQELRGDLRTDMETMRGDLRTEMETMRGDLVAQMRARRNTHYQMGRRNNDRNLAWHGNRHSRADKTVSVT